MQLQFILLCLIFPACGARPPIIGTSTNTIVNRPDHLKAVALERDGELNPNFRKEVLLGMAEDVQKESTELPESLIQQMFKRADINVDGRLTEDELKKQILKNTEHHLAEARKSSERLFQEVDLNGDGLVSWAEYTTHLLVKNSVVDKDHAQEHAAEHTENFDSDTRSKLEEEKSSFQKADAEGNGLDEIEWLGFQHPEHSRVMLKEMTNDILSAYDADKNGILSLSEFLYLPPGVVDDERMDKEYTEARRREFQTIIDKDGDGSASIEELRAYVDPLNEAHIDLEVQEIFEMADANKDGNLTLKELLDNAVLLASSGFVHVRNRLHDDL